MNNGNPSSERGKDIVAKTSFRYRRLILTSMLLLAAWLIATLVSALATPFVETPSQVHLANWFPRLGAFGVAAAYFMYSAGEAFSSYMREIRFLAFVSDKASVVTHSSHPKDPAITDAKIYTADDALLDLVSYENGKINGLIAQVLITALATLQWGFGDILINFLARN